MKTARDRMAAALESWHAATTLPAEQHASMQMAEAAHDLLHELESARPQHSAEDVRLVDGFMFMCQDAKTNAAWRRIRVAPQPSLPTADQLAQIIREVDGSHSLGAGALAEKILERIHD